ncbi:MAG TPA: hypothetical protein VGU71_22325 [Candidatus Dormibacteraeota bacterium]|nr:hypothetical protein [Candidatus Dormibacteraeota bacterium]
MKPKSPEAIVDSATARKNGQKLDERQPIDLDLKGAVASVIVQLVTQATAQAIQADEPWKVHVASMEFVESEQSLRITGLQLRPIK